ncbi:DUF4249 domain-containing protein [Formosa sp. S-31]|uniref:DUF4249 domain-containing protein n=1 Tax=Formosa sp. S-31 TaxID=2790949 RepID=UPI003EBBAC2C
MKLYKFLAVIFIFSLSVSCTDVVDVEVPTAEPRLVIEASLDWLKGTSGQTQTIKLSTTTPYFELDVPNAVTGAQVQVAKQSDNTIFEFTDNNDGTYTTTGFDAVLGETYTLTVVYEGEVYTATETLLPTTPITQVFQSKDGGIFSDVLEVNVYFNDPAEETNFYVLKYQDQSDDFPSLMDVSDEFLNGNEVHLFFEKNGDDEEDEFQPGDVVDINLYNVSERYYNYIKLLNSQLSGNPFAPPPVEIRGNCINETNPENYAYGYFRVTETDKRTYTFTDEN